MTDTSYIERMVAEGDELATRLEKLMRFGQTQTFYDLGEADKALLSAQSSAMRTYLEILGLRIHRAAIKEPTV